MNNDVVINVSNISKKFSLDIKSMIKYGIYDFGRTALGARINCDKLRHKEFWAVDDLTFKLHKGETLGIIGQNGSGKSTVLKMLNGIYMPDKGTIEINGKVGALIEVGAGFHPLLTGRENIYVNGAILGMSKKEIDAKFDAIVSFADIGDFLDSPVKNYSSGMYVRLGFAIAIHCDPEILLVDEILAVGDVKFQSKCYSKIAQLKKDGVAIILVAHNMDSIRHMCDTALLLSKGKLTQIGDSDTVVLNYIKMIEKEQIDEISRINYDINKMEGYSKSSKGQINTVSFLSEQNFNTNEFNTGDKIKINIEYEAFEEIDNPVFAIHFYSKQFLYLSMISNNDYLRKLAKGNGVVEIVIEELHLPAGIYTASAVFSQDVEYNHIDWHDQRYLIHINKKANNLGLIALPTKWNVQKIERIKNCE